MGAFPIGEERWDGRWRRGSRRPARDGDPRRGGGRREPGQGHRCEEAGQEARPAQAGVPGPALRVQDLEGRATAGRPVAAARDGGLAALSDHVPPQADPARSPQLQPQAARLLDGRGERPPQRVRLQHDEQRPGTPGQRRQPPQPVPHPLPGNRGIPSVRQVQDQQVHGPGGEQRPGQREGLLEVCGRQDHEPLRADPARDGLHGIERTREVQPRDDRPARLCLRGHPEGDRGLARGRVPAQRHSGGTRQTSRAQDGVQRGEPRGDDATVQVRGGDAGAGPCGGRERRGCGDGVVCLLVIGRSLERHRRAGERAFDRPDELVSAARSGRAPARLERGESLGDVGCASHRTSNNRTNVLSVKDRGVPFLPKVSECRQIVSPDRRRTLVSRARARTATMPDGLAGAGARRGVARAQGPLPAGIEEALVAGEPRDDGAARARGPRDRCRARVVAARPSIGVAVRGIPEFREHPGAEDGAQSWQAAQDARRPGVAQNVRPAAPRGLRSRSLSALITRHQRRHAGRLRVGDERPARRAAVPAGRPGSRPPGAPRCAGAAPPQGGPDLAAREPPAALRVGCDARGRRCASGWPSSSNAARAPG